MMSNRQLYERAAAYLRMASPIVFASDAGTLLKRREMEECALGLEEAASQLPFDAPTPITRTIVKTREATRPTSVANDNRMADMSVYTTIGMMGGLGGGGMGE